MALQYLQYYFIPLIVWKVFFKQHLLNTDLIPNPKWILFYSFKTANHVHMKYILLTYFSSSSLNTAAFTGQEKVTKYNIQRTQLTKN